MQMSPNRKASQQGNSGKYSVCQLDIPSLKGGQGVGWALKVEEPEVLPG